jgi:hypothetical protein
MSFLQLVAPENFKVTKKMKTCHSLIRKSNKQTIVAVHGNDLPSYV